MAEPTVRPPGPGSRSVPLHVNGSAVAVDAEPARSLLSVLRDDLDLTGTKYGCGEGDCGACTVLLDGEAVRACQVDLGMAAGRSVTTIEGLGPDGALTAVQRAFLEETAFQCGFCTPGMIVRAEALLGSHPAPSDPEIAQALEGNLCRCGGYGRILRAVRRAAEARGTGGRSP
jgi:aerobic-type carbon monoxide dehydrogenase small subunit (CoxS/CutS family)